MGSFLTPEMAFSPPSQARTFVPSLLIFQPKTSLSLLPKSGLSLLHRACPNCHCARLGRAAQNYTLPPPCCVP